MSRKVFISFLGTGRYQECRYRINGETSEPVKFVQEALIKHFCQNWTEEDRIFIFCTYNKEPGDPKSRDGAWELNYNPVEIGLQARLAGLKDEMGLRATIEDVKIDSGFSESEIWGIFNTVYGQLMPGDEIYFDVTHAFRSIPIFSIVLFNHSKFMKGTQLKSISYGAFEARDNENVAPVIDLTNIARLQEYNQIASSLKDFGRVKRLGNAITVGQSVTPGNTITNLRRAISQLDEYIATIDLQSIKRGNFIRDFRRNLNAVRKQGNIVAPIETILDELDRETQSFVGEDDYRNIEAAIKWTIDHDMLTQTYPLAEEYVILRISNRNSSLLKDYHMYNYINNQQERNRKFREFVGGVLGAPDDVFDRKNWNSEYKDAANYLAGDKLVVNIRPLYNPIRNIRNKLVHGNGFEYCILQNTIPQIQACIKYLRENDN